MKLLRPLALAPLVLVSALAAPAFAQQAPTPGPTQTPRQDRRCPDPVVAFPGGGINTGQEARITVGFDTPQTSATYTVALARETPAPAAVVRTEQTSATGTAFMVRLGETHTFTASMRDGGECVFGGGSVQFTVPVRPSLSIAAKRDAVRDYSFTGRVTPGRGQAIDLYRVTDNGLRVLSARSTVRPDGTYRIDRRFTGSGRFGFEARVGNSATNLAGASAVRPTVIH